MSEVSSWDPVDDGNTAAPPNGWPEFMQPSAVNNAARAMMGAVRRWYDTVTAQLAAINAGLGTKVSRAGDTMSGSLTISASGASLGLNRTGAGTSDILGSAGGVVWWVVRLGDTGASNFEIHRAANDGTFLGMPFTINRGSGEATFAQALTLSTGASAAQHATRKDYVDQRDTDWYNLAWSNITTWAAGQDTARVAKSGDTMSGALSVPYTKGGPGDAGTLLGYGGHTICFRWVDNANGAAGNSQLEYRVDEIGNHLIAGTRNAFNLGWDVGGGGPVNVVWSSNDGNTWFYCHADFLSSDARLKTGIAQSEIDALSLIGRLQLSQFDYKPEVVALYQSVGKTPEERAQMVQNAQPAHVDIGFVAQQVREIIPEAVFCASQHGLSPNGPLPDDLLTINNQMFVPYLVRAVQQLAARVEALEAR